jgi:4-hydroxythreonine-4-phosphate dehydrogenase
MPTARPRLALTLGDCAGIGPELVLRALASSVFAASCQLQVYGSLCLLSRVAASTEIPIPESLAVLPHARALEAPTDRHVLFDFPFETAGTLAPGVVQADCGAMAYAWICAAVRDIQNGRCDALVTAPLNKEALHLAGIRFPGHTEILADLTGTPDPCMAFYSPGLVVSLATIHEALADVPRLLTTPGLLRTIRLTRAACCGFGCEAPRLGVLALNPHAGEHGLFGDAEARVILPAIAQARAEGLDVSGPLVPDTAFTWLAARPARPPFDAYVAMYHDQGLIPFKMVAFDTGVNVTLGLPLIRTSPDHGTAFDLAWQGTASPDSLFSAIALAARMVRTMQAAARAVL